MVGTALLLVAIAVVSWVVARRPDRLTILVGLCVLALAFFVLPTRVHERYLFPLFALGAILAAVSVRWRVAYVALSFATFLNMYVVLTTLYPGNPRISDWLGIGPDIRSVTTVTIVALIHLGGFVWVASQLRRRAERRLVEDIAASRVLDAGPVGAPEPGLPEIVDGRDLDGGAAAGLPVSRAGRRPAPAPWPRPTRLQLHRGVGRRSRRTGPRRMTSAGVRIPRSTLLEGPGRRGRRTRPGVPGGRSGARSSPDHSGPIARRS